MSDSDIGYDPFLWNVQDNPYPYYQRMREQAPVYHLAARDLWVVTRWDDCMAVLTAPHQWSSARGNFFNELPQRIGVAMPNTDPPRHTELRTMMDSVFSAERIAGLEPMIRATVRQLIGRVSGECDFMSAIASPLTASIMGSLFGIPRSDFAQLGAWLAAAVHTRESNQSGTPAPEFALLFRYIAEMVSARRAAPTEDATTALTTAEVAGARLANEEIIIGIGTIIAAAIQSMNMQLGNMLAALAQHPEQRALVRAEPSRIPAMIEEVARWDPAIQCLLRSATRESEIAGVTIPAGGWLLVCFAAANHDPAQFPAAERFDITRTLDRHLGFSWGPHQCFGRPLGRLAMRVAFEELLPALGEYQLVPEKAVRTRNPNMRGYQQLPITF